MDGHVFPVDALTIFGVLSVSAMMVFHALEERSPHFVLAVLAFAVACLLASAYGFLQGAWQFGVVELVWSAIALNRWRHRLKPGLNAALDKCVTIGSPTLRVLCDR